MIRDGGQVTADPDQRRRTVGQVQVGTALLDQEREHRVQVEPGLLMTAGLLLGLLLLLGLGLLRYLRLRRGDMTGRRGVLARRRSGHQTGLGRWHPAGLSCGLDPGLTGGPGHRLRNVLGREQPGCRRLSCGLPGIAVLHRILLGTVPGRVRGHARRCTYEPPVRRPVGRRGPRLEPQQRQGATRPGLPMIRAEDLGPLRPPKRGRLPAGGWVIA
ncbi:hypothetical protein Kisp02_39450 [Kineosporia sp. NBRC 101731]|nr:hypothetical protein Kisp02_39450 [Kineosporia sp. NBRC 101731]